MARIIICNREDKTERNSSACTSANSESRRKLESSAPNNQTTVDAGRRASNVEENAPASKRRVANKVTRLAQKFNSTSSIAEKQKKDPSPLQLQLQQLQLHRQRHHQQRVRKQITHQRCQQRAVAVAAPAPAAASAAGGNGVCRVKETVRLFEIDSNRVCVDRASMLTNGSASAKIHSRRRVGYWSDAIEDANANANANVDTASARLKNWKTTDGGAVADTATSAQNALKSPMRQTVRVCEKREEIERPSRSSVSVGVRDDGGECGRGRVCTGKKQSCAGAKYNTAAGDGDGDGDGDSDGVNDGQSIRERRCVSMLVKDTQTYASFDVRSLKNRPLSVAQHFLLESALNDANSPTSQQRPAAHRKSVTPTAHVPLPPLPSSGSAPPLALAPAPPLSKNTSFLHRTKTFSIVSVSQRDGDDDNDDDNDNDTSVCPLRICTSDRDLIDTVVADDVYGYSNIDELGLSYSSTVPSCLSTTTATTASATAIASTFSSNYRRAAEPSKCTEDGDSNVYDTVLYSELCVVRPFRDERYSNVAQVASDGDEGVPGNGDDECSSCSTETAYEAVSPLSQVAADADSDSNSDSSLEKANSLYETKETTAPSSSFHRNRSQTAISTSTAVIAHTQQQQQQQQQQQRQRKHVERDDAAADKVAGAATTPSTNSSASVASDDWLDVNEWESADEIHLKKIAIVKKRRVRLNKLRKLKRKRFRSYQTEQKVSIRVGSASTIYIADKNQGEQRERRYDSRPKQLRNNADEDEDSFVRGLGNGDGEGDGNNNRCRCRRPNNKSSGNVTVLRSVLYLLPKYEAQEISTLFLDSDRLDDVSCNADDSIESKSHFEKESADGGYAAAGGIVDNFSEELCDDFDDTSSDENDYTMRKSPYSPSAGRGRTVRTRYSEKNFIPSVQSQNIYEFMKKARKTVRKSWSSFNQQMRKSSVNANNVAAGASFPKKDDVVAAGPQCSENDPGAKFGNNRSAASASGSVRWASFKTKLRPKYSTVSAANSSSIFYLNPEDLRFDMAATNETCRDGCTDAAVVQDKSMIRRRRTTCLDLNLTRPRPSSPPPPPPGSSIETDKRQCAGENTDQDRENQNQNQNPNTITNTNLDRDQNDVCAAATYAFHSPSSSSNSDLNLSSCSDLRLRFADEPLYQFYAESVAQRTTNASMIELYSNDSDGYEEIGSLTSRPSAMELITPSPNGHGQCRSLWCEVDEVKNSGFLEKLSIGRQKLQEAKFEVITSEASYYKSLSVLDGIFVNDARLRDENLVCKNDWKILFANVAAVRKCSQALLSDLEKCWQEDIMLAGLSNVIFEHASTNFKIFVKYCSNQIYIDRTLKKLREESANFAELISKLEADPVCQSLSLHSFLMLPMQRITRMPLLVDAILSKLDPIADQSDYKTFKTTLAKLNKIVKDCNENARKFERYEEMLLVSRQLEFSRKDVKMFSVASSSRWLVRSGPLMYLNPPDAKLTITRKLTKNAIKLYFFLFNDILVIAKKKSEESYAVVDYCLRNVLQISSLEDTSSSLSSPFLASLYLPHRYLLLVAILENHEGKTVEMVLSCDSDSTRQRWLEACCSRLASDNPEEKLYEEWDCPQVLAVHLYLANQPDELSLQNGDVVKVLKKTTDGWYHGERIRDGVIGWFPGNYTIEIASQHTRAKNLKLRHRLLTLSADYLQNQQQK